MRLSYSVDVSVKLCSSFLQAIAEHDANILIDAIKKDAVAQFARQISVFSEEQSGYSYSKPNNALYYYSYGEPSGHYDWITWFGHPVNNVGFATS
jgi:hypothetical protein